jgi:hypothetical protein
MDLAAKQRQVTGERISDGLCAALGHGPADGVRCHAEHQADSGAERPIECEKRVGR